MYTDLYDTFEILYRDYFLFDGELLHLMSLISNMWLFVGLLGFIFAWFKNVYKWVNIFFLVLTFLMIGDYFFEFSTILRSVITVASGV